MTAPNEVKPVAWMIDVAEQENQYFVGDIEDALDDLTNHNAVATPLFTSPLSPEEMLVVLNALKDNHEWHQNHDDYGGYEDCQLSDVNHAAIKLLESRL